MVPNLKNKNFSYFFKILRISTIKLHVLNPENEFIFYIG